MAILQSVYMIGPTGFRFNILHFSVRQRLYGPKHRRLNHRFRIPNEMPVGVDIGSSTSHFMFANVQLQGLSEALASRVIMVGRKIQWKSLTLLTP